MFKMFKPFKVPRLYCRMHGEMLIENFPKALLECPEVSVCGTYVTDEFLYDIVMKSRSG